MEENTQIQKIDVDSIAHHQALKVLFREYAAEVLPDIEPIIVDQLFALPYFHGFLCFTKNQPSGFAVCFESYSTYRARKVLNIHDFMVSKSARGKGLGSLLLGGIEKYCRDHDYLKITLEVDEDNFAAKRLYASCGYQDYRVVLKDLNHWQKYLV